MAEAPTRKERGRMRRLLRRLRSKYRLVLIDDRTFEERFSLKLNRLSVLVFGVLTFALYGAVIVAVIVFTPLKRWIPGYSDQETKLNAYRSTLTADSLEMVVLAQDLYIDNLKGILGGDLPRDSVERLEPASFKPRPQDLLPSRADSLLRAKEDEARYDLVEERGTTEMRELAGLLFIAPVEGIVTVPFERSKGHYGLDIVAKPDAAVKVCLGGTVTLAGWTSDAGHVLHVQHSNGLVSVYKHNRVLLKRQGDRVKAGEAIAIVGNTGENSTGPHLHFELWHNGEPVDPAAYVVFKQQ